MQRKTARLLETTFEPKSVKHINLPKDIEQDMHQLGLAHWRRSFRDAASASADSNPSPAATIPGST
jgi:succinate dehydrogenase assembly factor 1